MTVPLNDFLGKKAKDKITGFEGTCTGFCVYLSGCNQVLVAPPVNEKGEFQSSRWFDVQRCELLESDPVKLDADEPPGFDSPAPIR